MYQCTCDEGACQPPKTYIGYTTTTVRQRMTCHAQNGSILNHSVTVHDHRIKTGEILENIEILYQSNCKQELEISEALHIKALSPQLNNQLEGQSRILKVF